MDNSGNLRIVIATEIFPPTLGGPATHLEILIPRLIESGYSVSVVTFGNEEITNTFGATVFHVPLYKSLAKRWIVYTLKLFNIVRRGDSMYVLGTVLAGLPSFIVSKIKGVRYVLRIPGDFIWEYVRRNKNDVSIEDVYKKHFGIFVSIFKKIQQIVVNRAAYAFATSKTQAGITKYWKIHKDVEVVYSPVLQKDNSNAQKENRIIATGRLVGVKGFDVLLHDIHSWMFEHRDWRLDIFGDGPEKEYLQSIIRELGMEDQVEVHDPVSLNELHEQYAQARVAIIYSEYDALPHSLFEAMSNNISVIAPPVGGIPEIITQYSYGHMIAERSREELMAALDEATKDSIDVPADISSELSVTNMTERIVTFLSSSVRI
ncbi:MAG: glycosyltransferase family 4 protein [Patescibacteria group bacterium]